MKTYNKHKAELKKSGVDYTCGQTAQGNNYLGVFGVSSGWMAVYAPNGEFIGQWEIVPSDTSQDHIFQPMTYTNRNLDGAAICRCN